MPIDIAIEFDAATESLDALHAAAYRLIDLASCQVEAEGDKLVCRLTAKDSKLNPEALRQHFLDLVTDENVRQRLSTKTEPIRNLILSLAFGALTSSPSKTD